MTLTEFGVRCQSDDRLKSLWDRLVSVAKELIHDELIRAFYGEIHQDFKADLDGFNEAKLALIYRCRTLRIEVPDLSLKQFIDMLLKY